MIYLNPDHAWIDNWLSIERPVNISRVRWLAYWQHAVANGQISLHKIAAFLSGNSNMRVDQAVEFLKEQKLWP